MRQYGYVLKGAQLIFFVTETRTLFQLITTSDCSNIDFQTVTSPWVYKFAGRKYFSAVTGAVHLVNLNRQLRIQFQHTTNHDHCQIHNIVPKKRGRNDFRKQGTSPEIKAQYQSLTPAIPTEFLRHYKSLQLER